MSDLVAKGLTNQQIAGEMFLSTHTVAFHLRQVFRKLDISSRVDLARVFTEQAQLAGRRRARRRTGGRARSEPGERAVIARAGGQGDAMGSYQYTAGDDTWQWSDGVYAIHGFHRGEVVPTTALLLSHAHAADRRQAGQVLRACLRDGKLFSLLYRIIDAAGQLRWALIAGEGTFDDADGMTGIRGYLIDVTESQARARSREVATGLRKAMASPGHDRAGQGGADAGVRAATPRPRSACSAGSRSARTSSSAIWPSGWSRWSAATPMRRRPSGSAWTRSSTACPPGPSHPWPPASPKTTC